MTQQHKSSRKAVADPLLLPNRLVYEGQPGAGEFALSFPYLLPSARSCSWPKPFLLRDGRPSEQSIKSIYFISLVSVRQGPLKQKGEEFRPNTRLAS